MKMLRFFTEFIKAKNQSDEKKFKHMTGDEKR